MERFIPTWIASSVALAFAAWLLGDHMSIGDSGDNTLGQIIGVLLVGLVFTIITSFVAPVVKLLSLPFIIVTLGLALLVINALLLLLTAGIADAVGLHFEVDGFWWAVLGSVVISLAQTVVSSLIPSKS